MGNDGGEEEGKCDEGMIVVGSTDARVEEVKGHGLCHVFFWVSFVIKIETGGTLAQLEKNT